MKSRVVYRPEMRVVNKDPGKKTPAEENSKAVTTGIGRERETAIPRSRSSCLGTENLVGRLAAELKNKIDLLLDYLPGRGGREGHGRRFQGRLLSSECLDRFIQISVMVYNFERILNLYQYHSFILFKFKCLLIFLYLSLLSTVNHLPLLYARTSCQTFLQDP